MEQASPPVDDQMSDDRDTATPKKVRLPKGALAATLMAGIIAAYLWWYPFWMSLAWPGLIAARAGMVHAWVIALAILVTLFVLVVFRASRTRWFSGAGLALCVSAAYCTGAYFFARYEQVPLPVQTMYDAKLDCREKYLKTFADGYRGAVVGYCPT